MGTLWWVVLVVALIVAVIIIALYWLQLNILFHPRRELLWKPQSAREFVYQGLHGWHLQRYQDPQVKTILHCHGNSGNISHLKHIIKLSRKLRLNLIVWDYRGYGNSTGSPSPHGVYEDGEKIYRYATEELGLSTERLILWGESLGGAVATHVASKHPCSQLVLVATFSSLDDILLDHHGYEWWVIASSLCLRYLLNVMPSKDKIRGVQAPVMIIHSQEDKLIPYANAERLLGCIGHEQKQLLPVRGTHSQPQFSPSVIKELVRFCSDINSSEYDPQTLAGELTELL